jgi:hypothetical protein
MGTPAPPVLAGWIIADLESYVDVAVTVALLAGAIGAGVAMFLWVRNWRRQLLEEPTAEEQLESYRTMLGEGTIDPQEFERIRDRLRHPPEPPLPESDP